MSASRPRTLGQTPAGRAGDDGRGTSGHNLRSTVGLGGEQWGTASDERHDAALDQRLDRLDSMSPTRPAAPCSGALQMWISCEVIVSRPGGGWFRVSVDTRCRPACGMDGTPRSLIVARDSGSDSRWQCCHRGSAASVVAGDAPGHARGNGTRSVSAATGACSAAAWSRLSRRTTAPLRSMVSTSSAASASGSAQEPGGVGQPRSGVQVRLDLATGMPLRIIRANAKIRRSPYQTAPAGSSTRRWARRAAAASAAAGSVGMGPCAGSSTRGARSASRCREARAVVAASGPSSARLTQPTS